MGPGRTIAISIASSSRLRGLRPGEQLDLGPAFDLEDPHRIPGRDLVVHHGVVEGDAAQVDGRQFRPVLGDELDALLHQREHAQGEEVHLDKAGVLARVLVPLADHPPRHAGLFQRHQLHQGPGRDHHPPHVLGDVAGKPRDLLRQGNQIPPERRFDLVPEPGQREHHLPQAPAGPAFAELGQLVQVLERQPQRLADVPHGAAQPVGGERADQRRVLPAVVLVHPLDQRLADVPGKIEVDVGHHLQRLVEKAVDRQAVLNGIDVGQADQVADERADRAASPSSRGKARRLARRAGPPDFLGHLFRKAHQVPVDQEKAGKAVPPHQRELLVEPRLGLAVERRRAGAVPLRQERLAHPLQLLIRGLLIAFPLEIGEV